MLRFLSAVFSAESTAFSPLVGPFFFFFLFWAVPATGGGPAGMRPRSAAAVEGTDGSFTRLTFDPSTRRSVPASAAGTATHSSAAAATGAARKRLRAGIWDPQRTQGAEVASCKLALASLRPVRLMPLSPTKNLLRRRAAALLLAAATLFAGTVAAGCGGGDDNGNSEDATALIEKAFGNSIKSANVKLEAELKVQGLQGLNTPIQLSASGPYIGGKDKLPQMDMDVKLGARGQGQSLQTGLLSTGDRVYVKFGGEYYEQPKANVDAANRDLAKRPKGKDNPLGIDPTSWLSGAKNEGEQKVAGADTTHVSARVDVEKLLADLNDLARKGAGAVGGANTPQPLTDKQLADAARTVKDPTFDVYVSKDDETIRRMSGNLEVAVPEGDRAQTNGITGGSLRFTVEMSDVNGDQKVEAPARSRPISELSRQLGGASALGQLGGSGQSGGQGGTTTTPPSTTTPGTTTAPQGGANDPDSIRRYIACLDRTSPGDDAARERCRSELE